MVLLNGDGKAFFAERADIPGAWQLPQGGIDPGEDPQTGALRELYEETGITPDSYKLVDEYPHWLTYTWPDGKSRAGETWVGQAQRWFLCRFTGDENAIDLNNAPHHEFTQWRWATVDEILDETVAFRRPVYEKVLKHFEAHIKG